VTNKVGNTISYINRIIDQSFELARISLSAAAALDENNQPNPSGVQFQEQYYSSLSSRTLFIISGRF